VSPRTYNLISHPIFVDFVSNALALGLPLERAPFPAPRRDIPVLTKTEDISLYLGVSPELLWTLIRSQRYKYNHFPVKKRGGGARYIAAPRTYMKVVQWWILDLILSKVEISDRAFGFVKGRNYVDNAREHQGATNILNVDIREFFPSINASMVRSVFSDLRYSDEVSIGLAMLTTYAGALPQGAPTSPAISNIIFKSYDEAIVAVCDSYGIKYSRYADDMTFSKVGEIPKDFHKIISSIIHPAFHLNEDKTVYMGANRTKEVTGVVLGRDAPCLSRADLNRARGWIHRIKCEPLLHIKELEKLRGTIAMVKMVGGRGSGKISDEGSKVVSILESLNI
jgi:hypothetical protein